VSIIYTGRPLAARLGYDAAGVEALPDRTVESFRRRRPPFALRRLERGERVVDVGSGAGFDSFVAAAQVGPDGRVLGVDMTPEMLQKSRAIADLLGLGQVEFREGRAGALPVGAQTSKPASRRAHPWHEAFALARGVACGGIARSL
jgi:SAM-dependent methyltransferase